MESERGIHEWAIITQLNQGSGVSTCVDSALYTGVSIDRRIRTGAVVTSL